MKPSSVIALACILASAPASAMEPPSAAQVSVCFVPAEKCTSSIIAAIDSAKREIRVQAYGFDSQQIIAALIAAKNRGVSVEILIDKTDVPGAKKRKSTRPPRSVRYPGATVAAQAGIPVWVDYRPAIAHNKLVIVDRHLVIGGSFNYSDTADKRNAENVTFTESTVIAARFLANWASRQTASRPYAPGDVAEQGSSASRR